ncbi:MAG TPA: phosphatase PAP2 family protein [Acholeplasma sp.]|nr:phosphatase PAP2 family protein [Acholeplasma sp.]
MKYVEFFQQFSNPVFDWFFRIITEFGDQYFFIILGAILYWTIDKKFAFKFMITFLASAFINGGLKELANTTRPYQNGAKPILGLKTTGSSMPSGHAQSIGVMGIVMTDKFKHVNWVKYGFYALMVLVPISRVYLGQHYLHDVIVGLSLGIFFGILFMFLLSYKKDDVEDIRALYLVPILVLLLFLVYNKDLYVASFAYMGLTLGYFIEKRYVKNDIKGPLKHQIIKVAIGLIGALLIKEGLKPLFALFSDEFFFDGVRYFLVALWASLGVMFIAKKYIPKITLEK